MIALMSKWVYGFIKHNSSSQSMNQKFFKFSFTNIKYIFEISVFHPSVGETYKVDYYLPKISSKNTLENIYLIELQWFVQFNHSLIGKSSVENWNFSVFFKKSIFIISWISSKIYLYLWIITLKKIILWYIEALKNSQMLKLNKIEKLGYISYLHMEINQTIIIFHLSIHI